VGGSAVPAAHGRTGPCHALLDRWRTDRLHCSRNQPAAGRYSDQRRTADAILQSSNPDIAELKDIVKDILHDDLRATEVIRRMRSLLKKAPFEQKQFDLTEVVQETIGFFSALAVGRKFEMVNVITPEALPI